MKALSNMHFGKQGVLCTLLNVDDLDHSFSCFYHQRWRRVTGNPTFSCILCVPPHNRTADNPFFLLHQLRVPIFLPWLPLAARDSDFRHSLSNLCTPSKDRCYPFQNPRHFFAFSCCTDPRWQWHDVTSMQWWQWVTTMAADVVGSPSRM